MAWYTEQIFSDFLNCNNNHAGATKALISILDDNVILNFGHHAYCGVADVLDFLEKTHCAISTDEGFTAHPVIFKDSTGDRKKAVALFSKLEPYVSWLFRIRGSIENWKITNIDSERPDNYELFYDIYEEADYDDEGNYIDETDFDDDHDKDESESEE